MRRNGSRKKRGRKFGEVYDEVETSRSRAIQGQIDEYAQKIDEILVRLPSIRGSTPREVASRVLSPADLKRLDLYTSKLVGLSKLKKERFKQKAKQVIYPTELYKECRDGKQIRRDPEVG
jgi:hypothetical protein